MALQQIAATLVIALEPCFAGLEENLVLGGGLITPYRLRWGDHEHRRYQQSSQGRGSNGEAHGSGLEIASTLGPLVAQVLNGSP